MDELRYPIGPYRPQKKISASDVESWIAEIAQLPSRLANETRHLTEDQLDTKYRESGWTVRQLIHHIADSHMNAYIRTKLCLTEEKPTIKPYQQDLWAKLSDSMLSISGSLKIIEAIHYRWTHLLKTLNNKQLNREFNHPETGKVILKSMIGHYAWHGRHHLAHITSLKNRNNWT